MNYGKKIQTYVFTIIYIFTLIGKVLSSPFFALFVGLAFFAQSLYLFGTAMAGTRDIASGVKPFIAVSMYIYITGMAGTIWTGNFVRMYWYWDQTQREVYLETFNKIMLVVFRLFILGMACRAFYGAP